MHDSYTPLPTHAGAHATSVPAETRDLFSGVELLGWEVGGIALRFVSRRVRARAVRIIGT